MAAPDDVTEEARRHLPIMSKSPAYDNAELRPQEAHVTNRPEAEGLVVKVRRLLGVADIELNVVVALDGQEISGHVNPLPIFTGSSRTPRPG